MRKPFFKGDQVRLRGISSATAGGKVIYTQVDCGRHLVMVRFDGEKFSRFIGAADLEHVKEEGK